MLRNSAAFSLAIDSVPSPPSASASVRLQVDTDRLVDASVADELAEESGRVLRLQRVALAHRDGRGALGEPHEDEIVDRLHDPVRAQESAWKVAPERPRGRAWRSGR